MDNSVIIKGNKHGIVVVMDENIPFDELKEALAEKFRSASKFFDKANMAVSFEGRKISASEEKEILDIIAANSELNIICVVDNDKLRDEYYKKAVDTKLEELSTHTGQFYKGTLRSGQVLESESSIIILGDVNPGARVISTGNVVVLGSLKGLVFAGANGNQDSFVVALEMAPMFISSNKSPAVTPKSPNTPPRTVSPSRHSRSASDSSRFGSVNPQIPLDAVTMRAAGDTSFASTAAVPTTSPPMIDTAVPIACGRWSPASCSSSKESSMAMTSVATPKGTYCFAAVMDSSSFTGSISW